MANKVVTNLEKLNLMDRFLFDETMEDLEAYQAAISILLENEIELLEKPETEKEFRISPQLREIRLDVISMDQDKKLYYTEMQKKETGNLRKRSRYYQSQLDVSLLEPGSKNFNLLNDSCLILICPFDVFGKGLYRYTFEGVCRECPDLKIDDGAVRIFINTKGKNRENFSQEFLDFIDYLAETTDEVVRKTNSKKIKIIHQKVRQIRTSEKMGVRYMQRWEEIEYAKDEGGERKVIQMVCKKLLKGKTPEVIAEELEEDLTEIQRICDVAKDFAPTYDCDEIHYQLYGESVF